jgi:hypothetical protein
VAVQYEALRIAGLGQALAPEARGGLALFLRRGMWGWARALTTSKTPTSPTQSHLSKCCAPEEQRALIEMFVALAMSTSTGEHYERVG